MSNEVHYETSVPNPRPSSLANTLSTRLPRQQRSKERFEVILNAAERTLLTADPEDVSIHMIAEEAGISPSSIYHFFPDAKHVFASLAERYFNQMIIEYENDARIDLTDDWLKMTDDRFEWYRRFYNQNKPACKIILGASMTSFIRARDLAVVFTLADYGAARLKRLFIVPEIPDLVNRLVETIVMNDALWGLSVQLHGHITEEFAQHARFARIAYLRTFLPEYLPRRP